MPRKRSDRQQAWDKFGLPKAGAAALTRYNREVRPYRKLCGARTKSTETHRPCQNPALAGHDRCRLHGGATPQGDQWGLVQWPNGKAPNAEARLQAKLKRIERTRKEKAKRLAAMSPEERQRRDERARTHAPGPAAARARKRQDRQYASEIQSRLDKLDEVPVTPELAELQAKIAALEEMRDQYRRIAEEQQQQQHEDQGVFG